uniref:Large ribosomal subunit protein bL9 C-terminal domain-containing protein n=1 Tax=Odontella aurita TaxID=265563 RepID=A0A7S4IWM6_9STRA
MVAPAFFENKLRKTQSAVVVTDEEVKKEREEQAKDAKETLDAATEMMGKIEGLTLTFPMKAGPNGHLFGGVNYKAILKELIKQFPKGALGKGVKIETVQDEEGKAIPHDIKEVGDFKATVSLMKDVSADIALSVVEQK